MLISTIPKAYAQPMMNLTTKQNTSQLSAEHMFSLKGNASQTPNLQTGKWQYHMMDICPS
jgi:hypothetical protein